MKPGCALHFELPNALVLNANDRTHWREKAAVTRNLRAMGCKAALEAMASTGSVGMARAHLTVQIGWPDHRRRDAPNIYPTLKALIDGVVDAGLLVDDDDTHLIGPDFRPRFAGRKGLVVLDFEFEEVAP